MGKTVQARGAFDELGGGASYDGATVHWPWERLPLKLKSAQSAAAGERQAILPAGEDFQVLGFGDEMELLLGESWHNYTGDPHLGAYQSLLRYADGHRAAT